MRRRPVRCSALAIGLLALLVVAPGAAGQSSRSHWVGTWTTSVIGRPPYVPASDTAGGGRGAAARLTFPHDQTVREIVHATIGGARVRVVLTNVFGTAPLRIGAAHVAVRQKDAAIVAGTDRTLTFSGQPEVTIPAGAIVVSDPAMLLVPAFGDLAIDLFVPDDTADHPLTVHRFSYQTSYLSASGNHAGEADLPDAAKTNAWYFLADVEVSAADRTPVVITLGDSITDGTGSTADTNGRWPDVLARRLAGQRGARVAVLNAGIAGNRLLSESIPEFGVNILARFDRDVLVHPGVTHVVVMEGINDIGGGRDDASPSASDLIAADKQLIERAHARGVKIIGATLTPFEGAAYYTETGEAKRQAVNAWIRGGGGFDGIIDFDAAVRDPENPKRFAAAYDSGDHLHLNDAGYKTMADAIDLRLFK